MTRFQNAMEVFKLLKKNNCRDCEESTCLAFAAAVFKGRKNLSQCPHIDERTLEQHGQEAETTASPQVSVTDMEAQLEKMRQKLQYIDLADAARRTGGQYAAGRLTVKVMGKDLSVDAAGRLSSDLHIHGWLVLPFFAYVISGQGAPLSNRWVPLRELESGKDWAQFFNHRCEKPLKQVADTYTDLFEDMVRLFNGKPVDRHYQADISLVLYPFPRLPMLICYWKPEEGLSSSLNIFFDANAEKNLSIESIYLLATGLVRMFEKIALRHGVHPAQ